MCVTVSDCTRRRQPASILTGITRDTVITLAKDLGIEVVEQAIPREMLYIADEIFLTGTAAEVTPVRSVDHIEIGNGERGPGDQTIAGRVFRPVRRQNPEDQLGLARTRG